jgi:oxygen-dependent protoporphyrinogen oxidase
VPTEQRAVVVGAGIAGLVWALEAAGRGWRGTVLEADDRPGGAVRRGRVGGVEAELGAEAFAVARPAVLDLVAELGLADQVVRPATHQAHLATRAGLVPLPTGFLGIPVDLDDVARLLGTVAATEAARRDTVPVAPDQTLPATLGALVRQRLGDAVATQLVDPVVAGVHATPADEAELASVAPPLAEAVRTHGGLVAAARALRGPLGPAGAPVATLEGGLSRLVDALVERLRGLGVRLLTGTAATGLARRSGGWQVTTLDGTHDAEVVAVALPADRAAALLGTAPDELATITAPLQGFRPTVVTVVSLLVEAPALTAAGAPVGSGVLVAPDVTTVQAKAMTHASAKWAHVAAALPADHHLLRLSYGGRGGHAATDRTATGSAAADRTATDGDTADRLATDGDTDAAERLVRTALANAAHLLGVAAEDLVAQGTQVTRWRHGLIRPLVGRRAALDAIDTALTEVPDLALVGGAVAGNGLLGVVARSRAEAARTLA